MWSWNVAWVAWWLDVVYLLGVLVCLGLCGLGTQLGVDGFIVFSSGSAIGVHVTGD